jgi:hypothetical protein
MSHDHPAKSDHSFRRGALRSNREAAEFSGTGRPRSDHAMAAGANSVRSLRIPALFEPISIALPAHRNLPSAGFNPSFNHRLGSGIGDGQQESMSIPKR